MPLMNYVQVSNRSAFKCGIRCLKLLGDEKEPHGNVIALVMNMKRNSSWIHQLLSIIFRLVNSFFINSSAFFIQAHQNVFGQLVDLIGITSIMEVIFIFTFRNGYGISEILLMC